MVEDVREALGANLVGVYLQGSFALGDGDAFSDVDFIVVTQTDIADEDVPRLNAMHAAIHGLPEEWAQHLEGSYVPAAILRQSDGGGPRDRPGAPRPADWADPGVTGGRATKYPLLFLNNGSRQLVRSQHDNTLVVSWVLRERGIALWGPPARSLIDPIDLGALRDEVAAMMRGFGQAVVDGDITLDALHLQGFTVLFCCRALVTLERGRIVSKPVAADWAREALDERWRPLIARAWADRARYPRGRGAPEAHAALKPSPDEAALTREFVRYAFAYAERRYPSFATVREA